MMLVRYYWILWLELGLGFGETLTQLYKLSSLQKRLMDFQK